jgi:hypothetical protein
MSNFKLWRIHKADTGLEISDVPHASQTETEEHLGLHPVPQTPS